VGKSKSGEDRKKRIEDLKRRVEQLCGGQMTAAKLDDCSAETEEAFWKYVADFEEAPWTTHLQQLEEEGVSLPPPDSLKDGELTAKLWEVIQKLASFGVFIEETDHLSDRELYTRLWTDCLREETKAFPLLAGSACHIQMLGSGSEEDNRLYLKYYADDDWRQRWQESFPSDLLPRHEDPPYDRDRLLPKPDDPSFGGGEPN